MSPYLFTGRASEVPDAPPCSWFVRWVDGVLHVPTRSVGELVLSAEAFR